MQHDELQFTVETIARPNRVKVIWEDDKHRYWFYAEFTGDQIDKVVTLPHHRFPTIMRLPLNVRAALADYFDAGDFTSVILAATRHIRVNTLITHAIRTRDGRLAAQEAARIAENAKRVRNALATTLKESRDTREALGLPDELLADREALVIVQNMPDAFLHRVAAILGCD